MQRFLNATLFNRKDNMKKTLITLTICLTIIASNIKADDDMDPITGGITLASAGAFGTMVATTGLLARDEIRRQNGNRRPRVGTPRVRSPRPEVRLTTDTFITGTDNSLTTTEGN